MFRRYPSPGSTQRRSTVLAAIAASIVVPVALRAQTAVALRVATTRSGAGEEPRYARDRGFFRAAGLDVAIAERSDPRAFAGDVAAGRYDVAFSGIGAFVAARVHLPSLLLVAPAEVANGVIASGWFASAAFVAAQPQTLKRFANAVGDTARWANKRPPVPGVRQVRFAEQLTPEQLQPAIDAAVVRLGLIDPVRAVTITAPGMLSPV